MIEAKDILTMVFYSYGKPFTGSCDGMRYRIKMEKRETGKDADDKPVYEKYFEVHTWPEPYSFENTEPEKISREEFAFTDDGFSAVLEHLNSSIGLYKDSTRVYNIREGKAEE